MIGKLLRCLLPLALLVIGACVPQTQKDYSTFYSERPRSILIVPVVNNTVDIDAPRYFLSTVTVPLAERGYYTFPVNLVRGVMNEEGLSDANLVHNADPTVLGAMFGADAILYISIEHWETVYIVISATTTVSFKYTLKSGLSGETLWEDQSTVQYTPQGSGGGGIGGLVAMAVAAAIQKAAPNYMPLAKQANRVALWTPGKGLPNGPYHGQYGGDIASFPGTAASAKIAASSPAPLKPDAGKKEPAAVTPSKSASIAPATPTATSPAISAAPVAAVSVVPAEPAPKNACRPGLAIDPVVDRGQIERGIRDYAEIIGIGSPYPARRIRSFGKIEVARDRCGTGEVRVTMTIVEAYSSGGTPTGDYEFLITKNDRGLKVTGCKNC